MKSPSATVVVPVFNEEEILAESIGTLTRFLKGNCPNECEIVIADNGSTDRTWQVAEQVARGSGLVRALHLDEKGRGGALKAAWGGSGADILSYMDVDLSTDLAAFPELIEALGAGGRDGANGGLTYEVATASRLLRPETTRRCLKREALSRIYNAMVRRMFGVRFSDAQCGFKAITRQAAARLLPLVEDSGWFFDTELLVLAEELGYRVYDFPAKWTEGRHSRVKVLRTAVGDLRGMVRLRRRLRELAVGGLAPRLEASASCRAGASK